LVFPPESNAGSLPTGGGACKAACCIFRVLRAHPRRYGEASLQPPTPGFRHALRGERAPAPPGGVIPPQRLAGFIRWPVRVALWPFVVLDLAMQRFWRVWAPLPYRVEGQCQRRGDCCHYIVVGIPPLMHRFPVLERAYLAWLTEIHGFYRRGFDVVDDDDSTTLVVSCRYLMENGSCAHHWLRPTVCRQWPVQRHHALPSLLPGCGYRVVPRKGRLNVLP
jgi:hypothetical protein